MIPVTTDRRINLIDKKYDFPSSTTPRKFYAIATMPRSGSTFFGCKLWNTGVMGAPLEYFNIYETLFIMASRVKAKSIRNYVDRLFELRTSANGVFGMSIFPEHLQFILLGNLLPRFPRLKYIYLTRNDVIAQAVSYAKALQTRQWTNLDIPQAQPEYNYNQIANCLNKIQQSKLFWNTFFNNNKIRPIHFSYEKITTNTDEIISNIMVKLDIHPDLSAGLGIPSIEKQPDTTSQEWKEKFCNELKIKQPELAKKLNVPV